MTSGIKFTLRLLENFFFYTARFFVWFYFYLNLSPKQGFRIMAHAKKPSPENNKNRRSGLDRRWIIAPHDGPERRRGGDRRKTSENGAMLVSETGDLNEIATIQDLLMANSMQLDAMAQLLIEKGIFSKEELFNMLKRIQQEYQKTGNSE
jgi:hypothetical protein